VACVVLDQQQLPRIVSKAQVRHDVAPNDAAAAVRATTATPISRTAADVKVELVATTATPAGLVCEVQALAVRVERTTVVVREEGGQLELEARRSRATIRLTQGRERAFLRDDT
jgi:hypothetical protein